ncbi:MAG: histidinol dehydrogenase, partial [Halanaerobiales bacterium]
MKILNYQDEADRKKTNDLLTRRGFEFSTDIREKVIKIIDNVKKRGDKALFEYTSNFDDIQLNSLKLKKNKLQKSKNIVDEEFLTFLKRAEKNIKDFHQRQKEESWFSQNIGSINGQLINPLERIGAYVPGGSAAYPSSVLMTVIPAQIAGVEEIVVVTPPDNNGEVNPYTLAALDLLGIKEVYTVGGAQAVAALAYGTESILSVDKIVGPGNIYVTMAKKEVYGKVDIDMLAGPS